MHCIKLLGDKLMARSFPSQVNEIHARVAVLNRFTELGRPLTRYALNLAQLGRFAFQIFVQQSRKEEIPQQETNEVVIPSDITDIVQVNELLSRIGDLNNKKSV